MFDAGFLEMLVIGVIALVIVGPERLPGIARKVGKWIAKARALVNTTKSDIERELRTDELRNMLIMQEEKIRNLQSSVENTVNNTSQQVEQRVKEELAETETLLDPQPATKALDDYPHSDVTAHSKSKQHGTAPEK
jgi:sec-independent protein translocase protein TatB